MRATTDIACVASASYTIAFLLARVGENVLTDWKLVSTQIGIILLFCIRTASSSSRVQNLLKYLSVRMHTRYLEYRNPSSILTGIDSLTSMWSRSHQRDVTPCLHKFLTKSETHKSKSSGAYDMKMSNLCLNTTILKVPSGFLNCKNLSGRLSLTFCRTSSREAAGTLSRTWVSTRPISPTPSAALRYWNMARQRYCRRLARHRHALRVSADPLAKPAAHTRAESRGS